MEIFSRYRAAEIPDNAVAGLSEHLERVWEMVGQTALEGFLGVADTRARNGDAGVLKKAVRPTALILSALRSTESLEDHQYETVSRFCLPFDVVQRFAQPMRIDFDARTNRIIGQPKGMVRLPPVDGRAKQPPGDDSAQNDADWFGGDKAVGRQQTLFPEFVSEPVFRVRCGSYSPLTDDSGLASPNATTPGPVDAALRFQVRGATYSLWSRIRAETQRGLQFPRLANALSALYPRGSRKKGLPDAMPVAI